MTLTHSTPTNNNTKPTKKFKFKVKSKKPSHTITRPVVTNQHDTLQRPHEPLCLNDNMIMNNTKTQKKKNSI